MTARLRVAVVGVGDFGRQHARVYAGIEGVELVGVLDTNRARAEAVAREFGAEPLPDLAAVAARAQAASVAVPTADHLAVAAKLIERGVDVLVEKPMASTLEQARQMISAAERGGRILQVGHVERFNPAVVAAARIADRPQFFEVHRLGVFTPRSLDVDVVYDVMIHDLDILLALAGPVSEVKAVGIPVVTDKVDIAHARLEFDSGAVANLTASRISTERVRKLRFFQQHEYISVDYGRRDALRIRVAQPGPEPRFEFEQLPVGTEEPLRAELKAFVAAVRSRQAPVVDGRAGRDALELADRVMAAIHEHAHRARREEPARQAAQ
jgi:predicted dehydrogenase